MPTYFNPKRVDVQTGGGAPWGVIIAIIVIVGVLSSATAVRIETDTLELTGGIIAALIVASVVVAALVLRRRHVPQAIASTLPVRAIGQQPARLGAAVDARLAAANQRTVAAAAAIAELNVADRQADLAESVLAQLLADAAHDRPAIEKRQP